MRDDKDSPPCKGSRSQETSPPPLPEEAATVPSASMSVERLIAGVENFREKSRKSKIRQLKSGVYWFSQSRVINLPR